MTALCLRKVDRLLAQATRELGAGQQLGFSAQGRPAELTLLPMRADTAHQVGEWLDTAVGPLRLSDAEALLSLLGDLPVTLGGEQHAWYWQLFNQRLSPVIADLLAPIEPRLEHPTAPTLGCRIRVRLGEQRLDAHLHATPDTLIRLLRAGPWHARLQPADETMRVNTPLIIGQLSLTLEQLASLRPGDVLLPADCAFDSAGHGLLSLAGRHWAAHVDQHAQHLYLRLSHEEHGHNDD